MAEKKWSMKVWFFWFLLLSMVAFSHGKTEEDEMKMTETKEESCVRKLSDRKNSELPPPSNPYHRGCSPITRCRGGGPNP